MSQTDLASEAKTGLSTVKDFEGGRRTPIENNLAAMKAALEARGVLFVDGEKAWGIAFAKPERAVAG
jgi:ribosome-binding protein aMBF1 (putative translation factor)